MKDFEASFGNDQRNSIAVMESYVQDSHKDKDFYRKLEKMWFKYGCNKERKAV